MRIHRGIDCVGVIAACQVNSDGFDNPGPVAVLVVIPRRAFQPTEDDWSSQLVRPTAPWHGWDMVVPFISSAV